MIYPSIPNLVKVGVALTRKIGCRLTALRRMGYDTKTEITGHGFRAMARTILHQELSFAPEVIEHQLAHSVPDSLGTAYNRTKFMKERRAMMQRWADYLEKLKAGADVIPLHANAT